MELAKKNVERVPNNGNFRSTLGAALYRAGDWKSALTALEKSLELRGQNAHDWYFFAMAQWQLGEKEQARRFYQKAVAWTDAARHGRQVPRDEEVHRFRTEAAELLGIAKLPKQAQGVLRDSYRFAGSVSAKQREQAHEVKLQAGKTYAIDLESKAFDTFLRLHDAQGKKLAENDDISPDNLNSRLIVTPQQDGAYRVVATAFEPTGVGPYTLTAREFVK